MEPGTRWSKTSVAQIHLEIKNVSYFENQGSFLDLSGRGPPFVVDPEDITQGFVNKIETDIGGDLLQITVVLDQCVQEHPGIEGVVQASGHQIRVKIPRG